MQNVLIPASYSTVSLSLFIIHNPPYIIEQRNKDTNCTSSPQCLKEKGEDVTRCQAGRWALETAARTQNHKQS